MMLRTPWETQCKVFNEWRDTTQSNSSKTRAPDPKYFDDCLRLALCYKVGFGTRPDSEQMLRFLGESAQGNDITKALCHRIVSSLALRTDGGVVTDVLQTSLDFDSKLEQDANNESYFKKRIMLYQSMCSTRVPYSLGYTSTDLSTALCRACQIGDATKAMELCIQCKDFAPDLSKPTPVHWLIMFDDREAELLGKALVVGSPSHHPGPCRDYLDSSPTEGHGVTFISEHCLELVGSPLHWAVRTRNDSLVRLLNTLGADLNVRWGNPARTAADEPNPELSPLDVAVQFHLPDMVQTLLDLVIRVSHLIPLYPHSVFHCIGRHCAPFSRHLLHGAHYRQALRDTIELLIHRGFDVNGVTPE
jgi:hypothetical protein